MDDLNSLMESRGVPAHDRAHRISTRRFPDGAKWRVEIPSVEGPEALAAVLEAAAERDVPVHRVSQGSGITLQTDAEIREMVALGREHAVEVCLFVGPRAGWGIGMQPRTPGGSVTGATLRGASQLRYAMLDIVRACELGLRCVLIADLGQLWLTSQLRAAGDLPEDLVIKTSVSLPCPNPATARVLQELGADTINLGVDLELGQIAAIRQAVDVPLDVYVEGPDDLGAPVRHHEIPELVELAAPLHLKFAVRNSPGIYPAGEQLRAPVLASARERVRRAAIGLEHLHRSLSSSGSLLPTAPRASS